jgi:hypothetical protein
MLSAAWVTPPPVRHVDCDYTSLPFRILGVSPWLAFGFVPAALPCTPVVADAIVDSGKSPESHWIQTDAMNDHQKCML